MEQFDLIEFQQTARETNDPKKLFELWEDVCRRKERNQIGQYELDEMKEVIFPQLEKLAALRKAIDNAAKAETPATQNDATNSTDETVEENGDINSCAG